jgi:Ca-activated chloride channel homolog
MTELTLLRPWWLLGLIPAIGLLWLVWQRKVQDSGWKQWIDPAFQPYLLSQQTASQKAWPIGFFGLAIIWLAAVIALTGPSWKQQPIAAQSTQTGSVILLDLSLSMYADDLQPNRLTRVQFKLTDLLNQHPEMRVGMVGYSASAHIITPISDDNSTLRNLLPHLNPLVMPAYGANAVAGFNKAIELLQGANITQRHIIWVTDDIEAEEIAPIRQLLEQHNIKLSLLAVGTPQGGAIMIPDFGLLKDQEDRLVQAQVPLQRLAELARDTGGQFSRMQVDDSDLVKMLPPFAGATEREQDDEKQLFQPLDYGVYLLWLLVPLAALAVRRGWLMAWVLVAILPGLMLTPNASFAETDNEPAQAQKPEIKLSDRWREMFLTGNQRGYQAWLEQDYLEAEREFSDPSWRGSSLYRQGRYEEAVNAFARDDSAQGHYNRGNALAKSGQLEEARKAYQTALDIQPDFPQAQHNLDVIEELLALQQDPDNPSQDDSLPPQPEQNQQAEDQASDQGEANQQPAEQTPQSGNQGQQGDTEQDGQTEGLNQREETSSEPSDEETAESQAQGQQQTEADTETEQDGQTGLLNEPTEAELAEQQAQQREREQAQQTWLNQIKDEPGVFLRRKFDYQYQQSPPANPQKDQTKLW